jgi:hypothetical protein
MIYITNYIIKDHFCDLQTQKYDIIKDPFCYLYIKNDIIWEPFCDLHRHKKRYY